MGKVRHGDAEALSQGYSGSKLLMLHSGPKLMFIPSVVTQPLVFNQKDKREEGEEERGLQNNFWVIKGRLQLQ